MGRRPRDIPVGPIISYGRWTIVERDEKGPRVLRSASSALVIRRGAHGEFRPYEECSPGVFAPCKPFKHSSRPVLSTAITRANDIEGVSRSLKPVYAKPPTGKVKICGTPPPEFLALLGL